MMRKDIYVKSTLGLIKPIFQSQLFSLFALSVITLMVYCPYLLNSAMGNVDAQWYHSLLKDVLIQYRQHTFPAYVGQSLFDFIGMPLVIAPGFVLVGGFIDFITMGLFSSLQVQHMIILLSALGGAISMYITLILLVPHLRWAAFLFAFLYITCPGIIAPISHWDAYRAVIALPFIPIIYYGLIRAYKKNDLTSALLVAMPLSIVWMAHPPQGFWLIIICTLFFGLMLLGKNGGLRIILLSGMSFLLLDSWQLIFTVTNRFNNSYLDKVDDYAGTVLRLLHQLIPGVFLPVNWSNEFLAPIQFGYSLWFLFFLCGFIWITYKEILIRNILICVLSILVLIYPIPVITYFIYHHMPRAVENMNTQWPIFRFYFLLAPFIIFAAYLSLNKIYNENNKLFCKIVIILMLFSLWNVFEAAKFTRFMFSSVLVKDSVLWQLPENYLFISGYGGIHFSWPVASYDPQLENRLLDRNYNPIPHFDNKEAIASQCLSMAPKTSFAHTIQQAKDIPIMQFPYQAGKKYAACFTITSQYCPGIFHVRGLNHDSWLCHLLLNDDEKNEQKRLTTHTVVLPVSSSEAGNKSMSVVYSAQPNVDKKAFVKFDSLNLMEYDNTKLPIKIESWVPYTATVVTAHDNEYLETPRFYLDGYQAWVNDELTQVLKSPSDRAMIPLVKGPNHIVLKYIATPLVRGAFYLSVTSWLLAIMYLIYSLRFRKKKSILT